MPRFARNDGDKTPNHFRTLLGIAPDAVVALYSGNMGGKQGLELLADVAKLCLSYEQNKSLAHTEKAPSAIIFVFCSNGAGRADLVQRCAGLPNVRFLDLQPIGFAGLIGAKFQFVMANLAVARAGLMHTAM